MKLRARIERDVRYLRNALRTLGRVRPITPDSPNLACDDLEAAVDKWPANRAVTFEGKTLSYAEFDALANRYASWAKAQGLMCGQTLAIFLPNRMKMSCHNPPRSLKYQLTLRATDLDSDMRQSE